MENCNEGHYLQVDLAAIQEYRKYIIMEVPEINIFGEHFKHSDLEAYRAFEYAVSGPLKVSIDCERTAKIVKTIDFLDFLIRNFKPFKLTNPKL